MAPPLASFPLGDLEKHVRYRNVNFKAKRRKFRDFDLETCELLELVQYSCTSMKEQAERAPSKVPNSDQLECFPFIRLFRRCGKGERMFHVETTAWEGEHAYQPPREQSASK